MEAIAEETLEEEEVTLEKEELEVEDNKDSIADRIVSHLLFHKALSGDNIKGSKRINRYIEMVHELEEGRDVYENDPYERTISIAFELLMEERLDPWDLDLAKFADFYVRRLDAEHLIDLRSAGRLIRHVWSILRIKSEDLLNYALTEYEEDYDPYEEVILDFLDDYDEESEYADMVLATPNPPIDNMVRRKGAKRPATLMELISALEVVKTEVKSYRRERVAKDKWKKLYKNRANDLIDSEMHKDDIQTEKRVVMEKLINLPTGGEIPLRELLPDKFSKLELLAIFVPLLHLAKEELIKMYQKPFPNGMIFVRLNGEKNAGS